VKSSKYIHEKEVMTDSSTREIAFGRERVPAQPENDHHYRQLVEGLSAAIYTCDQQGFITLYNRAAVALWGREPEIGKDLWCGSWKIFNPDGSPMPLDTCPMAVTLKEGRPVVGAEIIVERPDGKRIVVAPHPQPIFNEDGEVNGAINMLIDITDKKESERLIRENEERLRLASDATELGTWDLDVSTRQLITSAMHRKIFGFNDTVRNFDHFLAAVHPDDVLRDQVEFQKGLLTGKLFHEIRIIRTDGAIRWIRVTGKTLYDVENNPLRVLGTVLDITDQVEAKNDLERKVEERTKELRQINEQLEKSNDELEQFAYIASHDLQEPLRKIQTFTSLLEANLHNKSTASHYFGKINSSAVRMSALIRDVLDYSRLAKEEDNFVRTDMNQVVDNVVTDFELLINEKNAIIRVEPLPIVRAIPHQLYQVVSNLISNALKFSARNPLIEIFYRDVPADEIRSNVNFCPDLRYVRIVFRDNGIGFEQKFADQIFTIFKRLNSREAFEGTGIGLAVCKKIIEKHGGFITATSEPNRGSTFSVILPMAQA
jgi:PAS domain S-box-containing protein